MYQAPYCVNTCEIVQDKDFYPHFSDRGTASERGSEFCSGEPVNWLVSGYWVLVCADFLNVYIPTMANLKPPMV